MLSDITEKLFKPFKRILFITRDNNTLGVYKIQIFLGDRDLEEIANIR